MLVAGEPPATSRGDLARALRAPPPGAALRMAAAAWRRGVELLVDVTAAAHRGTEVVGGVPGLYRAYRRLRAS